MKWGVSDLFFGDEGIGEVTGRLSMRGLLMTYELEAASPRLAVSGTGRIELNDEMDAELSFRVTDTSLDPYLRALQPTFSPYTSAIASGTIRVVGELYNPDALRIDTSVEQVDLRLLDYRLRNQAPIRLSVERQTLQVDALKLVGDDTELDLTGSVNLQRSVAGAAGQRRRQPRRAAGLPARHPQLGSRRSVGAHLAARRRAPVVSGKALLTDGRLRHCSFPHALEELNGIVTFDAAGIRLDGITARLGGGAVKFGGRIGLSGYQLSEFDVTATGEDMRLRYPEGMRSVVDAKLALQGPATAPVLSGTVNVKSASWTRGFGSSGGLFSGLTGGDGAIPAIEGQVARGVQRALRRAARRARDAAHRQRSGAHRRQRRPDPARHARSAAAVRSRRDRARRGRVRGPALSGDARQPRLRQPQSHPAVLRHRGRDARARARARPIA